MLEATPDSSKPSDFPVLLPINLAGQCEKLAVLVSTCKFRGALHPTFEQVKCLSDKEVGKYYKR